MSIRMNKTILSKGYFPKELPRAFNTVSFADFANSALGRDAIKNYKPTDKFTECCEFRVARTGDESRDFKIPHPFHFARLSALCSSNAKRLLRLAGGSPFASSSPAYGEAHVRAIRPGTLPNNLARDKALARAASTYLLRTDVSHFYPSLYTHAVGWAIDPKLRQKKYWGDNKLLGKKVDQNLMDLDKKFSQGIPIGNDLSFLLAEIVLAAVDKALKVEPDRCYRWFDDYEFACSSESEALAFKEQLETELARFRLRLNPRKTRIVRLPLPTQEDWQEVIISTSKSGLNREREMIKYFDTAFRLRKEYPHAPVLALALGVLFKIGRPSERSGRVAESGVTQALLCEPGSSQKALSLLSYWKIQGFKINNELLGKTFSSLIMQSAKRGTHDLIWALAFCLDNDISLDVDASAKLKEVDNDLVALLSLHMHRKRLLASSYDRRSIARTLKNAELDREHWLLCYESARHGFLPSTKSLVMANPLFSAMLTAGVTFYQIPISSFSYVVAPGCAPQWLIQSWLKEAQKKPPRKTDKLPKDLRRIIEKSLLTKEGDKVSPSEFRAFLRLHDLNHQPEPSVDGSIYG
jgi:hypothetical protein